MTDKQQYFFNIINNFKNCNVLVVGDIIVDEYIWGKAARLSPEAPVPVLEVSKYTYVLGGAANVAHNISALGGKVVLAGVIGNDNQAEKFIKLLKEVNIDFSTMVKDESRPTTVKTRLIAHNHQQLARADREVKTPINFAVETELLNKISVGIDKIDLIVLSDYSKGVLTDSLVQNIINLARQHNKDVLVDPKGLDFSKYKNASLITPNRHEAETATKSPIGSCPEFMAKAIKDVTNIEHVLITLGEDGVMSYSDGKTEIIPAVTSEVYDVTGAGDSLISALALTYTASNKDLNASIHLGNYAAGVAVRKTGTTAVSVQQLKEIIELDLEKQRINCG